MQRSFLNGDDTPIARRTDPPSSHLAAEHVTRTGIRGRQHRLVLEALKAQGRDVTSFELAYRCELDRYMVARRLPELRHKGLVEQVGLRTCNVSGRVAMTWRARG